MAVPDQLPGLPDVAADNAVMAPESVGPTRIDGDTLLDIGDIRQFFKLGRTAAYELTHRPDFPDPVLISPRCYRWWASEVSAFATALRRDGHHARRQRLPRSRACQQATMPRRITGTVRAARSRTEAR